MVTGAAAGSLEEVAGNLRNAVRATEFLDGTARPASIPSLAGQDGVARMTFKIRPGGSSASADGGMVVFTPYASEALKVARDMLERGIEQVVITDADGQPCDLADLERLAAEAEGHDRPSHA